ncbi:MAG: hypothetical protein M1815_002943 [Lichina confinis]|nr:MAG: hypothetical protein M1815_002943 [Lichina confinis]
MDPSTHAVSQYASTSQKLDARRAILAFDSNDRSWYDWLGERLDAVGDVLEVGAGTGELWGAVDHSRARLTLTDFSDAMCEQLRTLDVGLGGATVERCDAASLPFPDASFDLVVANHMLYHVDDPEAALREFARVLRPGARLAVALNGRDHIAELLQIGDAVGRPSPIVDAARISAETAPDLLSRHFEAVAAEPFPGEFVVPTPEPVLAYVASWGDDPLSADQDASVRRIVDDKIAAEGSFRIRKDMVLLTARRPS